MHTTVRDRNLERQRLGGERGQTGHERRSRSHTELNPSCPSPPGIGAAKSSRLSSFLTEHQVLRGALEIHTNNSSAFRLGGRQGPGRLKHMVARLLALQDCRTRGGIHLVKCATEDNVSDLLTKFVTKAVLAKVLPLIGVRSRV